MKAIAELASVYAGMAVARVHRFHVKLVSLRGLRPASLHSAPPAAGRTSLFTKASADGAAVHATGAPAAAAATSR